MKCDEPIFWYVTPLPETLDGSDADVSVEDA